MRSLECIRCGNAIPAETIGLVGHRVVECDSCEAVFTVDDPLRANGANPFDVENPPAGVRFLETDTGFEITSVTRSDFWRSFVLFSIMFSGITISCCYIGPFFSDGFENKITFGVFGIPFLLFSLWSIRASTFSLFGKVQIVADGYRGSVSTRAGPFKESTQFSWREIDRVYESFSGVEINDNPLIEIVLEGKERIAFGSYMSTEGRYFVANALEKLVSKLRR